MASSHNFNSQKSPSSRSELAPLLAKMGEDRPKVSKLLRDRLGAEAAKAGDPKPAIRSRRHGSEALESIGMGTETASQWRWGGGGPW